MDGRRGAFIFILLFFLFTAPNPHPPSSVSIRDYKRRLADEERALVSLNTSSYGDLDPQAGRWLPLAGLRDTDGYAWSLLPSVQEKARKQLQLALDASGTLASDKISSSTNITSLSLPVYRNVSGKVRGEWVRSGETEKLSRPKLNLTTIVTEHEYFTRDFGHNVTAQTGRIILNLHEGQGLSLGADGSDDKGVKEIKADMILRSDKSLGESWLIPLYGVHFPASGGVILTTASEKFAGLASIPHFALSNDTFELSRELLNKSLTTALWDRYNQPASFLPWSSLSQGPNSVAFPAPNCEYVMYLQQHALTVGGKPIPDSVLKNVEQELRFPIGAPIPNPPSLVMSGVIFSPDCGFVLETKGSPEYPPTDDLYLVGLKQEEYNIAVDEADERVFDTINQKQTASFLAFFGVSFLGMKFQIEIWLVQAPERREQQQQQQQQAAAARPAPTTLPLPVTAPRPADTGATPIILPPDQDTNPGTANDTPPDQNDDTANAGAMYSRFYFLLFSLLFFSSWALFWPSRLRTIYANTLSFIYLSFWTPQIYRNVIRNCRKALRWEFVVGQSLLRLFPFLYFYFIPQNVLLIRADGITTLLLTSWVWLQVWSLVSQDILGPRFFIPKSWVPPAYDYHPVLRDASASGSADDLEAGDTLPISSLRAEQGDTPSTSREGDKETDVHQNRRNFSCAICMQDINVPVVTSGGDARAGSSVTSGATHIFSRRAYMVTPCRHIFHSQCLETWMRLRLQCPICRESIPPI
ncbi:uncharacterized protein GIQ15_02519 [Arthroderma uncinatum]|uniref:uncharacterized protein n=1 Tax=Arthroderma uncinatum TaxID=74035 RepID=UPI00144AC0AD|nr:uncharacterized protein GIQ15_02519 [Arthroderma uncinatum]KAF3483195.1 hypothetical protein GIQ15_02519 [Arthroderma uncinatum]